MRKIKPEQCHRLHWLALLIGCACASQSRLAPEAPWPDEITSIDVNGSMVVPYPPPFAQIETVPPAPSNPGCVYLDGQWAFLAQDWQWVRGGWGIANQGCSFAQARLFWHTAGAGRSELRYRPGRWVRTSNYATECPAASPCSAIAMTTP